MNNQSKEQKNGFIVSVNEIFEREKINLVITDNPYDIVAMGRMYNYIKEPVNYGGPSYLIEGIMNNFSDAKFGISEEIGDETPFTCTKAEIAGDFFQMKLAVMMIMEVSEFINSIEKTQIRNKFDLNKS